MEVVREQCRACRSYDVQNLLVQQPGAPQTVFVRCAKCGGLVARYRLGEAYRHGEGLESYLRSLGPAAAESGRDFFGEFERLQADALRGFQEAAAALEP